LRRFKAFGSRATRGQRRRFRPGACRRSSRQARPQCDRGSQRLRRVFLERTIVRNLSSDLNELRDIVAVAQHEISTLESITGKMASIVALCDSLRADALIRRHLIELDRQMDAALGQANAACPCARGVSTRSQLRRTRLGRSRRPRPSPPRRRFTVAAENGSLCSRRKIEARAALTPRKSAAAAAAEGDAPPDIAR
jgi:hypothetical protein